jgi:hypothetical protein
MVNVKKWSDWKKEKVRDYTNPKKLFKEYLKFLNRLYYITWFGAVYD